MKLHKDTTDSIEPCKHMESLLNQTADGTASPLVKWYALSHAKGCERCGTFLARVTALVRQLRGTKPDPQVVESQESLTEDQWTSLESKWAEVEK